MSRVVVARVFLFVLLCGCGTLAFGQPSRSKEKPPEAGEILEVDDFGEFKPAQFVESLGNGNLFKLRLPDGQERPFPARKVRRPKNKAAAERKFAEASGETPTPATSSKGNATGSTKRRTWTDKTGKFKIEASFLEIADGKVRLKKEDGSEVAVALEKLSEPDQEIANLMASMKSESAGEDDNPFESVAPKPGEARSETQGDPALSNRISLDAPEGWNLKPDIETTLLTNIPKRPLALPKRSAEGAFFEKTTSLQLNPAKGQLWASVKDGSPGGKGEVRLEVIDATSGDAVAMHQGMKGLTLADFSPSGNLLCSINDDDFFKSGERVDVWKIDGKKLAHTLSLRPYKGQNGPWGIKVVKARLIDDAHLLTMNDQAWLVLWDIASAKPLWSIELGNGAASFDVSPSRKQLAVYKENACYVLDALTGKTLAKLPTPAPVIANVQLAISLDGTQLAMLAGPQLVAWDLASGKPSVVEPHFNLPAGVGNSIAWGIDGNSLIVDNQWLIDLQRRLVLCQVTGGGDMVQVSGGQHWSVTSQFQQPSTKLHTILHAQVPSKEVLDKAANIDEEQLLAIKPGTKVNVQFALPFDPATNDKIRLALFEKFKANGWTPVDAGGEAVLEAKVTAGKPYEVEYRLFGAGSQKVTVTPLSGSMELKIGGRTIWQVNAGWGPPFFLQLKEGQSIAEATQVRASPDFFSNTAIPQRIFAYPKGGAVLTMKIDANGVKVD